MIMNNNVGVKNLLTKLVAVKIIKDIVMDPSISEDKGKDIPHVINGLSFKKGDK